MDIWGDIVDIKLDQNMLFAAIFVSIFVDVFIKPFIKNINSIARVAISRVVLTVISVALMYYLKKETYFISGITTSVMAMLFYDVAGYNIIKKKVKEKLGVMDIEVKQ